MRLLALKVRRMPGFKEKGFRYDEGVLKEGINVILGTNGSGKTTSCLAVRKLLWPDHPSVKELSPVSLYGRWEEKGNVLDIEIEGNRRFFSCEMTFPPEQNALCYTILLDDLFEAKDMEFASAIAKIAYGGCDLEQIRKHFSLLPRMGQKERKQLYERRRRLEEISRGHLELEREEYSLQEIGVKIHEAKKAQEMLEKLKIAQMIKTKEKLLLDVNATISSFPPGVGSAREDDARKYQEIISNEHGEKLIAALSDQQLLDLEGKVRQIQELERDLKEVKNRTIEMEIGFKERFSLLGIDKESFSQMGVEHVGELERLWECWHAKVCELNEWDARIKAAYSQETPTYSPEILREGMRHLQSFLHAEDLKRLKMLLWAGPFLSLAIYKYPYICIGVCFFAFALLSLLRKASSGFFKRSFLELGLEAPEAWTKEGVRQHIARLEKMWGEAVRFFSDKETAQIIAVHKKKCSDEADNLYQDLREAGFPKEKLPWIPFVRELQRASELFVEVKKQEALVREEEKKYHELLTEIGVRNAHEALLNLELQQKNARRQKELNELALRKREILSRCKIVPEGFEEEWKQLTLCVEKREIYAELLRERAALEMGLKEAGEKLSESSYLLHLSDAEFDALKVAEETKAAAHDALIHAQATIWQKLDSMTRRHLFEEAKSGVIEAEKALENLSETFAHNALSEFLLNKVESLFESEFQPEVFKRANAWFIRFTHGGYRLHLMQRCSFTAFDMKAGEVKDLDSLSRGTRIQLILAIRLAFMETAEGSGCHLPLFLDEAMSHADDERFHYMAEALMEVAKAGRQIFYFTCQKSCVQAWQRADHKAMLLNVIDLDKMKQEEACHEFPLQEEERVSLPPLPSGKSLMDYSKELKAHGICHMQPPSSWHLCHFVSSSEELHTLALQNILHYGQFKNLSDRGFIKVPKLSEKGKLAEHFYVLTQIGRGRKVTWEDLEKGGVSEKFQDKVYQCAKSHDYDPKKLLLALENREVQGFREKAREELEESLITSGCLDRRDPLGVDEVRARLWQFTQDALSHLDPEESASFINALCELL